MNLLWQLIKTRLSILTFKKQESGENNSKNDGNSIEKILEESKVALHTPQKVHTTPKPSDALKQLMFNMSHDSLAMQKMSK